MFEACISCSLSPYYGAMHYMMFCGLWCARLQEPVDLASSILALKASRLALKEQVKTASKNLKHKERVRKRLVSATARHSNEDRVQAIALKAVIKAVIKAVFKAHNQEHCNAKGNTPSEHIPLITMLTRWPASVGPASRPHPFWLYNFIAPNGVRSRNWENA
jgi:hypothetical protein